MAYQQEQKLDEKGPENSLSENKFMFITFVNNSNSGIFDK
jgi:hypothetical protein